MRVRDEQYYNPEEISAMDLEKMKASAAREAGFEVPNPVVAVPDCFTKS